MRINAASVACLGLLALAVAAHAGGNNCGLCPAATSATWWEYDSGFTYVDEGDSYFYSYSSASTNCGSDLQVGGACEAYCWFGDGYDDVYDEGYFYGSSYALNGWGAEGPNAGTYCELGTDFYFYYSEYFYFVCDLYAWKLCCRAPGYWDGYWYGANSGQSPINQGRIGTGGASTKPTRPGTGKPLSAKVVKRVIEAKEKGNIHAGKPTPTQPPRVKPPRVLRPHA